MFCSSLLVRSGSSHCNEQNVEKPYRYVHPCHMYSWLIGKEVALCITWRCRGLILNFESSDLEETILQWVASNCSLGKFDWNIIFSTMR